MDKKQLEKKISSWSLNRLFGFIGNLKSEIKKVSWTSRTELIAYAKIVVGVSFVFGFVIYLMDIFIHSIIKNISFLVSAIIG